MPQGMSPLKDFSSNLKIIESISSHSPYQYASHAPVQQQRTRKSPGEIQRLQRRGKQGHWSLQHPLLAVILFALSTLRSVLPVVPA